MKNIVCLLVILVCTLALISGCATTTVTKGTAVTTPAISTTAAGTKTPAATTVKPSPSPTAPAIPAGSIALFPTLSGGSRSDFLRVDDIRVNWDTSHYKLLRCIPEAGMLDEFGWTTSKSYSKTYIFGTTAGGWLYMVKCFTDSGRKDISRLDPATGKTVATFGPITTSSAYGGFTICGDRLIYSTDVVKDQFGRYRSGGEVMVMKLGASSPVEVLDYNDENNIGQYYSMGNKLVSIVTSGQKGNYFSEIYLVDPVTLVLGDIIYSFGSKNYVTFFEGDTAIYWTETDTAGNTNVIRLPADGKAVYYLEISDTRPEQLTVDESQGKVLVSFEDDTPESPFFYLQDIATGEITELDVKSVWAKNSKLGNGQFVILE